MVSQATFDLYFKGQNVFFFFFLQFKSVRPLNLIRAMKSNANVRARVYNHFAITDNQHRPIFATTILTP